MFRENKRNDGFSLIELLVVVVIIGIIAAVAIPNLLSSRRAANEGSAISSMRVVFTAQATYKMAEGGGFFADDLNDLNNSGIVDIVLGCPAEPCLKAGYNFWLDKDDGVVGSVPSSWNVYASPANAVGLARTGTNSYYLNEVGTLFYKIGASPPTAGLSQMIRVPTDGDPIGR